MTKLLLNDYFARTSLNNDNNPSHYNSLTDILSIYDAQAVKKIFFAFDYDPASSVAIHLERRRSFEEFYHKHFRFKIKPSTVSVIPLVPNISNSADLSKLTLTNKGEPYIFITIRPTYDTDMVLHELHNIIYHHKFIPVIVNMEKAVLSIPKDAAASLYKIPRAVYQIDLSNLSSKTVRSLAHELLLNGKTVVFGSGCKFDICPYANPEYYTKLLKRTVSPATTGYFTLRHNQVFL